MGLDIWFDKVKKSDKDRLAASRARYEELDIQYMEEGCRDEHKEELDAIADEQKKLFQTVSTFRKVNFLLPFFNYTENCTYIGIAKYRIMQLVEACKRVLKKHNKKVSEQLLPTEDGFFFGDTEYDEYYYENVQDVLNTFTTILKETNFDDEEIQMYCWW